MRRAAGSIVLILLAVVAVCVRSSLAEQEDAHGQALITAFDPHRLRLVDSDTSLRNQFQQFDTNNDGVVTVAELTLFLRRRAIPAPDLSLGRAMIEELHSPGDSVSFGRFVEMRRRNEACELNVVSLFVRFGTDAAGVTKESMTVQLLAEGASEADARSFWQVLSECDADHDGVLSLDEMRQCMLPGYDPDMVRSINNRLHGVDDSDLDTDDDLDRDLPRSVADDDEETGDDGDSREQDRAVITEAEEDSDEYDDDDYDGDEDDDEEGEEGDDEEFERLHEFVDAFDVWAEEHPAWDDDHDSIVDEAHQHHETWLQARKSLESGNSAEAMRLYESACAPAEAAYAPAMLDLAEALFMGNAAEAVHDVTRAVELFATVANTYGHPRAHYFLGEAYTHGVGVPVDHARAMSHFHFAAEGGDPRANVVLGYRYLNGYRSQKSCSTAARFYQRAARVAVHEYFRSGQSTPLIDRTRLSAHSEGSSAGSNADVIDFYEYSAENGNVGLQLTLGTSYLYGDLGMDRNYEKAKFYLEMASEESKGAYGHLGRIYGMGLGVERDLKQAIAYYERGAESGDGVSCAELGYHYLYGVGVKKNEDVGIDYLSKAAAKGVSSAQFVLATVFLDGLGGRKKNMETVFKQLSAAGRQHHMAARYNLGVMSMEGIGTKRDCMIAVGSFKAVAENGPWGTVMNAALHSYDDGAFARALREMLIAADLGFEVAQYNVAFLLDGDKLESGDRVLVDRSASNQTRYDVAFEYFRQSAGQGHRDSIVRLGDYYYAGMGTPQDYGKSAEKYKLAGDLGSDQALFNLGLLHLYGKGMPRDVFLAKRYFDLAVEANEEARIPCTLTVWYMSFLRHYDELLERGAWAALFDSHIQWDNPDKGQKDDEVEHVITVNGRTIKVKGGGATSSSFDWKEWWTRFIHDKPFLDASWWTSVLMPFGGGEGDDDGMLEVLFFLFLLLVLFRRRRQQQQVALQQQQQQQQQPQRPNMG